MFTANVHGRECAFGIDVSNNNGRRVIDAQAVADRGFVFVVAKATEGATFRDAYYAGNRAATKAAGMLAGGYHWLKPAASLSSQVANFLNHTSNGAGLDFVGCDAEEQGLTDELVVGWCEQVHDATGLPIWLYHGKYTDPKRRSDRWLKFTPWLASYPRDADNDDDPTDIADGSPGEPWGRWDVWQYDSDGAVPGVAGNCDLNVIDLRVLAALRGNTPNPTTEDDMGAVEQGQLEDIQKLLKGEDGSFRTGLVADMQDVIKRLERMEAVDRDTNAWKAFTGLSAEQIEQALRDALGDGFEISITPKG